MSFFKAISEKFVRAAELSGQKQAQRQLLRMSAVQLDDIGISRTKLLDGVSGWPWTIESSDSSIEEMSTVGLKPAPVVTTIIDNTADVEQEQRHIA